MKMVSLAKFQIGKKSPEYSRKSVQNIQGGGKKKRLFVLSVSYLILSQSHINGLEASFLWSFSSFSNNQSPCEIPVIQEKYTRHLILQKLQHEQKAKYSDVLINECVAWVKKRKCLCSRVYIYKLNRPTFSQPTLLEPF